MVKCHSSQKKNKSLQQWVEAGRGKEEEKMHLCSIKFQAFKEGQYFLL